MSLSIDALSKQVETDIHACEQLIALFDQEREALKTRDSDALDTLLQAKATLLSQLENSAKVRSDWSQEYARAPSPHAWESLIEKMKDSQLKRRWQTLKELFVECKKENEINGRMIARNQQVFGRLMEIIRGQSQGPSLYEKTGSASAQAGSNRFGEA